VRRASVDRITGTDLLHDLFNCELVPTREPRSEIARWQVLRLGLPSL